MARALLSNMFNEASEANEVNEVNEVSAGREANVQPNGVRPWASALVGLIGARSPRVVEAQGNLLGRSNFFYLDITFC